MHGRLLSGDTTLDPSSEEPVGVCPVLRTRTIFFSLHTVKQFQQFQIFHSDPLIGKNVLVPYNIEVKCALQGRIRSYKNAYRKYSPQFVFVLTVLLECAEI